MMLTSCVVEFAIAEMACVSRNIRTTRFESLALFRSNVPFLNAMARILVKLSSKRHRLKPFEFSPHGLTDRLRLNCEPSSPMNAFSHILKVELDLTEMACVSWNIRRTLHVPSGVPVQRSISERSVSYPSEQPSLAQSQFLSCLMGSMLASCPFLRIVFLGFHFP